MDNTKEEDRNDKLSIEIGKFALYELKNQVREISELSVGKQEHVQSAIRYAARTVLDGKLETGSHDDSARGLG